MSARAHGRPRPARGFTLIEVMVAMAILAVSLVVIFDTHTHAMYMTAFSRDTTVATLLARSKMTDVEFMVKKDGFSDFDDTKDGDFSEEGFDNYSWKAEIKKVKLEIPDFGAMSGGGGKGEQEEGTMNMFGMQIPASAGMAQAAMPLIQNTLENAIRRVTLTISWKEGRSTQSFKVDTYLVNLGNEYGENPEEGVAGEGLGAAGGAAGGGLLPGGGANFGGTGGASPFGGGSAPSPFGGIPNSVKNNLGGRPSPFQAPGSPFGK